MRRLSFQVLRGTRSRPLGSLFSWRCRRDGQCEDKDDGKEEGGKRIVAKKSSGESDGSRSKYDMGKEEQGHKEDCCQWGILDQTFFPALDPPFSHAFGDREQTGKDADELKDSGSRIF